MKKLDLFLTLLFCSTGLALNAGAPDKEICAKDYFPTEEALAPSLADDADPAMSPGSSSGDSPSQIPVTPPEPNVNKPAAPAAPAK
ncbi:MAG: hypothetical protein JSR39_08065 [Verrucomicrobia bacterium]|nr:hypothetical protein [Verrucomicrobiota bacterium]